jgi:hypothetical protein
VFRLSWPTEVMVAAPVLRRSLDRHGRSHLLVDWASSKGGAEGEVEADMRCGVRPAVVTRGAGLP